MLADPRFAALFAPGSRAEVPIVGRIGDRPLVAGQVDRLVVTPEAVLIADYKTNRPAPRSLDEAQNRYPGLCRASSRSTAPCWCGSTRTGRCARRWCGPKCLELMEIPAAALDRALAAALTRA